MVSDIARIVISTNWTNAVSERHDLPELADPAKRQLLKHVFSDPGRLRRRGHDPQAEAHFINRRRCSSGCWRPPTRPRRASPTTRGACSAPWRSGAARRLRENANIASMGDTFDIPGETARGRLRLPLNPNGRPNADVLRHWVIGLDVTRRPHGMWIVDFG